MESDGSFLSFVLRNGSWNPLILLFKQTYSNVLLKKSGVYIYISSIFFLASSRIASFLEQQPGVTTALCDFLATTWCASRHHGINTADLYTCKSAAFLRAWRWKKWSTKRRLESHALLGPLGKEVTKSCTPAEHLRKTRVFFGCFFFFPLGFFNIAEVRCQQGENQTWPPRHQKLDSLYLHDFPFLKDTICHFLEKGSMMFVFCLHVHVVSPHLPAKLHFILLQQELNGCSHQAATSTTRNKALGKSLENDGLMHVLRFWFPAPKMKQGLRPLQKKNWTSQQERLLTWYKCW